MWVLKLTLSSSKEEDFICQSWLMMKLTIQCYKGMMVFSINRAKKSIRYPYWLKKKSWPLLPIIHKKIIQDGIRPGCNK